MKRLRTMMLQYHEPIASSPEWRIVQAHIDEAIRAIVWPEGSETFRINPVPKRSGTKIERNGVVPIKKGFIAKLKEHNWQEERRVVADVGKVDAVLSTPLGVFGVEWETGNISSSHRALNRLAKGLLAGSLVAGVLVVPSRALYRHLTDRIGNYQELEPYFEIWQRLPITQGVMQVIEVEHDELDPGVPRITRGTDGRALV